MCRPLIICHKGVPRVTAAHMQVCLIYMPIDSFMWDSSAAQRLSNEFSLRGPLPGEMGQVVCTMLVLQACELHACSK